MSLSYQQYGDLRGTPVFYFHGSPGSRLEFLRCQESARQHGLHVVAVDRPGMGLSPFDAEYTLLQHSTAVLALADALGWRTFHAAGLSGGAVTMYALAANAKARMLSGIDLTGWAPVAKQPELARQMAVLDRSYLRLARLGPRAFHYSFAVLEWAARSEGRLIRTVRSSLSRSDREWLASPTNARFFHQLVSESFRQGRVGAAHDAYLRYRPWGFDLSSIETPISLYVGTDDRFVPLSFAQWKARTLPNARLETIEGWGHLAFIEQAGTLIADATGLARR